MKLDKVDGKLLKHYMNLCVDGMDDTLRAAIGDDRFCFGWLNEIMIGKKKKYVVFIDYDKAAVGSVLKDSKMLQKKFGLGPAVVLKTMHGYHAYFFDIMEKGRMLKIMQASGHADKRYYETGKRFGKFVLRLGMKKNSKIEFKEVLPSENRGKFSYYHWYYMMRKFPEILLYFVENNYVFKAKDAVVGMIRCGVYSIEKPKNGGKK